MVPEDMSNDVLQSPQVASSHAEAGAIQIAGTMVKYDNVRLQLNSTLLQSAVQQHPAVSDLIIMLLCSCCKYMGCNVAVILLVNEKFNENLQEI